MNSSANLISLSDSGVGSNLSTSVMNSSGREGDFHGRGPGLGGASSGGASKGNEGDTGAELLIDFSDEVQVPVPQGILLQAEVDDTFGIFSMAQQSSQGCSKKEDQGILETSVEDEATKLVRSFTSERKSAGVKTKMKPDDGVTESEKVLEVEDKKDDSSESFGSDQVTIVESDGEDTNSHKKQEDNDDGNNENGIMEEKMNQTCSSNFSGGSDSEILDVDNLSSFSIPDDELDENMFINDVKENEMAATSVTAAIVNQIKLEMLQDENNEGSASSRSTEYRSIAGTTRTSAVTATSVSTTTLITTRNRLSSTSTVPSTSSVSSYATSSVLEDAPVPPKSGRARLSSGNFGSPIRASYPVSNRYFMPTPNAKAPSAAASTSRQDYQRDRLSDSLFSPSRTRVMLITGDSHRSPSRVPVRKSISAETLHYEHSTPARSLQRHSVKFSTPAAATSSRSRHSINVQHDIPRFPNLFGDDLPGMHDYQPRNVTLTDGMDDMHYRRGRQSYASSVSTGRQSYASNTSLNSLSPPGSRTYSRDLPHLTSQMNRLKLNDSSASSCKGVSIQTAKVTAIIAPTNLSKPILKPPPPTTATGNPNEANLALPPKTKPVGYHQGNPRPISASSPKILPSPSRPAANQTTPSRVRANVRSAGCGPQQNLNSTFGSNLLKSPNRATSASIKPAAIPKSLRTGVPSLSGRLELGAKGGGTATTRNGVTALKPPGKLPMPGSTGLRRPTSTMAPTASVGNKENKPRLVSTTASSRIGSRQAYHRQ